MTKLPLLMDGQIHQRIQLFINHLGISNNEFAKQINDSSAKISQVTSVVGKQPDFRISLLVKILARYPEVNTDWLLTGEGPMLKDPAQLHVPGETDISGAPMPPPTGWRKELDEARLSQQTIPLVEQKAYASYLAGFSDTDYLNTRPHIFYPELKGLGPLMAIRVQGESMSPTILPDDVLLCSYHEPEQKVKDGTVYVVCGEEGVVVKRIFDKQRQGEGLFCVSDNPEYPPFKVEMGSIRHLWRVRRRITSFMEPTMRVDDRLETVEQQLAQLQRQLAPTSSAITD